MSSEEPTGAMASAITDLKMSVGLTEAAVVALGGIEAARSADELAVGISFACGFTLGIDRASSFDGIVVSLQDIYRSAYNVKLAELAIAT